MSEIIVTCTRCNGKGKSKLNRRLQDGLAALGAFKRAVTVLEFSKSMGSNLTASHHLMKRMVASGVAKRVKMSSPATYQAVNPRARYQTHSASP